MVKALIDISDRANRMLTIVKAEYGLKDKSQAIDVITEEYEKLVYEPKLKPFYVRKLKKIAKEKAIHVGTIEDFDRMFHIKK